MGRPGLGSAPNEPPPLPPPLCLGSLIHQFTHPRGCTPLLPHLPLPHTLPPDLTLTKQAGPRTTQHSKSRVLHSAQPASTPSAFHAAGAPVGILLALAHCPNEPKPMAKCPDILRTTDGYRLVIRIPVALWYVSQIRCGGDRPPNFMASGRLFVGHCRRRHGRDVKGQPGVGLSNALVAGWNGGKMGEMVKWGGMGGNGGGVGTRPWWLALLACGGAFWPLALEPSAMTSRLPHYCGHPHCRGHPPAWGGNPECNFCPCRPPLTA